MNMKDFDTNEVSTIRPHTKRLGRELAMQFLFACELRNEVPGAAEFDIFFESICNELKINNNRLARRAKENAIALYQCVALHQSEIDKTISSHCSNWPWERLALVDKNIMRVAVAEMFYFPEVPLVVSIDEAVEIALDFAGRESGNFINGVLNNIKNTENLPLRKQE